MYSIKLQLYYYEIMSVTMVTSWIGEYSDEHK